MIASKWSSVHLALNEVWRYELAVEVHGCLKRKEGDNGAPIRKVGMGMT